jgi:hypothetical protein
MGIFICTQKFFFAYSCIYLRRGKAFMAEHFLNSSDIGSVVEKVRSKTVSELVWGNIDHQSQFAAVFVDHSRYAAITQRLAISI